MLVKTAPFVGIIKDLMLDAFPAGAVTDANNVRFKEGSVEQYLGESVAYATAPIAPVTSMAIRNSTDKYFVVLSQAKAYAVTGTGPTWTNITRQTASVDVDYAATLDTLWNGGVLNGVPVLNNSVDLPQYWSTVAPATKLAALPNWPATATCRVMRPFSNYLFALDVTKAGTRYPHRVKWSHPADPGSVPSSWDETDATKDAGEFDLDGSGYLIDCMPMRNNLIIYKENSTHLCTYTGAPFIWSFQKLFSNSGMLSPDCGVEVDGYHYVLTNNDFIKHDGNTITSVLDKVTRRWLFQTMDSDYYDRCFVTRNVYFGEVWVCYVEVGQTSCTKALVYNYRNQTVSFRDLPAVTSASIGQAEDTALNTWASDSDAWDTDLTAWGAAREMGAQQERTLLSSQANSQLVLVDSGTTYRGTAISSYMERTGISFDAPDILKTITRLRPRVYAPAGTVLSFKVGSQSDLYGSVTWSSPVNFTVGTSVTVDTFATGRYLAWRMESASASGFRVEALDIEVSTRGAW